MAHRTSASTAIPLAALVAACGHTADLSVAESTGPNPQLQVGRDGALFVADDVGNAVWRVSAAPR